MQQEHYLTLRKNLFLTQFTQKISGFKSSNLKRFLSQHLHFLLLTQTSEQMCNFYAKTLLEHGADINCGAVNQSSSSQKKIFMDLCQNGTIPSIKCLLTFKELKVDAQDEFGENALHYLLRRQPLTDISVIVEKILQQSPELIHKTNKDGETLLKQVTSLDNPQLLKIFLQKNQELKQPQKVQKAQEKGAPHTLIKFEEQSQKASEKQNKDNIQNISDFSYQKPLLTESYANHGQKTEDYINDKGIQYNVLHYYDQQILKLSDEIEEKKTAKYYLHSKSQSLLKDQMQVLSEGNYQLLHEQKYYEHILIQTNQSCPQSILDEGYESPKEIKRNKPSFRQKIQLLNVQMAKYQNYCIQDYLDAKDIMDWLLNKLGSIVQKEEFKIGTYGSYYTKTWKKSSDFNLILIPYKDRNKSVKEAMQKFTQQIEQIGGVNVKFHTEKNKRGNGKYLIEFLYESITVNIVFENDSEYLLRSTNKIKNFYTKHQPSAPVFFTLSTLLQEMGFLYHQISSYEIFAMIHEYSLMNETGNCALFLYRMLEHFINKSVYQEVIIREKLKDSIIIQTFQLKDPLNDGINLMEGKDLLPLISVFELILKQIQKCQSRQILRGLLELRKLTNQSQPLQNSQKQKYELEIKELFQSNSTAIPPKQDIAEEYMNGSQLTYLG